MHELILIQRYSQYFFSECSIKYTASSSILSVVSDRFSTLSILLYESLCHSCRLECRQMSIER